MRDDLQRDVLHALRSFDFKERGEYLREGRCPSCGKRSLWVRRDKPYVVRCDRLNRCGFEASVKDLFPEIFESWSERYPTTPEDPNAAAEQYLSHARGLKLAGLRGQFSQESFYSQELREGTATVRFPIRDWGADPARELSWWERFIDQPTRFGRQKARFAPGRSYGGMWWADAADTPATLAALDELWIVEGIFDAAALHQVGVNAVAALSSGNYPEAALARLREACATRKLADPKAKPPRLIFALDSDRAGREGIRKFVERARSEGWVCGAAQIPQPIRGKVDWNDLLLREKLSDELIDEYLWRGEILLAATPTDKALLLHDKQGRSTFPFDFGQRLWWASIDAAKLAEAREVMAKEGLAGEDLDHAAVRKVIRVSQIANCNPRPLYFQQDPLTDDSWYFYRVEFPHDGPVAKNTFTPSQIAGSAEFKKRLLSIAPLATFTGNNAQLDRLLDQQRERLRVVEAIQFVGYSREHRAYVFNDVAVKDGRACPLNEDDYFELGPVSVKSVDRSVNLEIHEWGKTVDHAWLDHLWTAFGAKGVVALAYWFASLFAEQIRETHKSFPFLELSGEPNLGKSTIIEFLWKLCGRLNYEGFDPSKSTASARGRNFAQVGNLPVVLMEGDRDDDTARARKFDFDELKSLYNGRSVRSRGVKTGGNETYEPPFRGSIVVEQNQPVQGSDAILSRIVALTFDGAGYNGETKRAADRLEAATLEQVSGFILAAAKAERAILAKIAEVFPSYEEALVKAPNVGHRRIAKCHAQLLAALDALDLIVPLGGERRIAAQGLIQNMAVARKQAIASDHPIVEAFWEAYDYIGTREVDDFTGNNKLNHARDDDLIAVNLNDFASTADKLRVPTPELAQLKQHLRSSKVRKFVATRDVNSAQASKTLHCWVFQKHNR